MRKGSGALVVGAGRFGTRALEAMRRIHPGRRLVVVDRDPRAVEPWREGDVETMVGDAVVVLDRLLEKAPPQWVIPAVPFHLAHAWVKRRLSRVHMVERIPVPSGLDLPNPILSPSGDVYCSFATFSCPEDCPEPREVCLVTGEERPVPLFKHLGSISARSISMKGLRSYQLAAGVGGYQSADLWDLLATVEATRGPLVLYTACRCHGVLSGLRVDVPV